MNLLFDTNILVQLSKPSGYALLDSVINPNDRQMYTSIVSIGELRSIALQNNWGYKKLEFVDRLLRVITVLEINESIASTCAEIDAFSQRRHPSYSDYGFSTPRNMGKNDLWIASTAALLGLKLVTTDADFDHLHDRFFEVNRLSPDVFKMPR